MKANSATILIKEGTHQQELNNFVVAKPICRQAGKAHYKAQQNRNICFSQNKHTFLYQFIP